MYHRQLPVHNYSRNKPREYTNNNTDTNNFQLTIETKRHETWYIHCNYCMVVHITHTSQVASLKCTWVSQIIEGKKYIMWRKEWRQWKYDEGKCVGERMLVWGRIKVNWMSKVWRRWISSRRGKEGRKELLCVGFIIIIITTFSPPPPLPPSSQYIIFFNIIF